jgi:centrosomal protein CEP350
MSYERALFPQDCLLHLRERALKEKTQAELAWLEQKKHATTGRDKGKDDQYPSLATIKKKKRGLVLKWHQEKVRGGRLYYRSALHCHFIS